MKIFETWPPLPAFLFLLVCFSCGGSTTSAEPEDYSAEEGIAATVNPYTWEKTGDTWDITLRPDHSFPLDELWSLYVYYSWTGEEDDLPLELTIQDNVYNFFPKTAINIPHAFKETFVVFHSEQWKNEIAKITLKENNNSNFYVTGVQLEFREKNNNPLAADPGTMMHYPPSSWRNENYEIFCHNLYPGMLYLVCDTFSTQSLFFKRLAFFTEKPGFVGRLARDEEIAHLRDWYAHDYRATDLAAFYDLARSQNFPLNDNEVLLRGFLLQHGIIRQEEGAFREGEGALLGFSVESADRLFVYYVHESVHGLEFIMPGLQKVFLDFFDTLSAGEKIFIQDALLYRGYNVVEDKQLLASETAAYLLQQSPEETDKYFNDYVLGWYTAYRNDPAIIAFLEANRGIFGRRSSALQKEFLALTGLNAKNFYDLLPKTKASTINQ